MIDTSNYIRFERVDSVTATQHGVLANLHGEQLRIDVAGDDVVRVKISRGGAFDESPTYAVCVELIGGGTDFTIEQTGEVVRLRTSAMASVTKPAVPHSDLGRQSVPWTRQSRRAWHPDPNRRSPSFVSDDSQRAERRDGVSRMSHLARDRAHNEAAIPST